MAQRTEIPQIPLAVFKANVEYQKSLVHLANDGTKRCMDFNETCSHLAAAQAEIWWERMQALGNGPSRGLSQFKIGPRQFQNSVQGLSTLRNQVINDQKALIEGLRGARVAWQQTFFDAVGNSEDAAEI